MKYIYYIVIFIVLFSLNLVWVNIIFEEKDDYSGEIIIAPVSEPVQQVAELPVVAPVIIKPEVADKKMEIILFDVPFTPQAPLAEWDDPRQQDGCEEAVALMAVKWARGEKIAGSAQAKKEILTMVAWEEEKYGEYHDTSAQDTMEWLIKGYYKYDGARVLKNISLEDIISELEAGNLVITPMNGQALANPYFTPPGPERHMLLIRGYDYETREFITNDPGTKRGELFRYDEDVLYKAIRDYPTGFHEKINAIKKNMIVIKSYYK